MRKYYCDFIKCKSLGRCIIPMSGEDCYTLGMVSEADPDKARKYEEWLKQNE